MNLKNLDATLFFEDKVQVKGLARISLSSKSCEFVSEFVPILPINSEVTIITRLQGMPILKITGQTFLSSKQFMRIQPINLALYEDAEKILEARTRVPAFKVRSHMFKADDYVPCYITACTAKTMTISGINLSPDHTDHKIEIAIEEPMFGSYTYVTLVNENGGLMFGKDGSNARYLYRIVKMEKQSYSIYLRYIRRKIISNLAKEMN